MMRRRKENSNAIRGCVVNWRWLLYVGVCAWDEVQERTMTATPALSNDIFGKYQQRISNDLYLDHKESEGVLIELRAFAAELLNQYNKTQHAEHYSEFNIDADPGDEHAG